MYKYKYILYKCKMYKYKYILCGFFVRIAFCFTAKSFKAANDFC